MPEENKYKFLTWAAAGLLTLAGAILAALMAQRLHIVDQTFVDLYKDGAENRTNSALNSQRLEDQSNRIDRLETWIWRQADPGADNE